MNLRLGGESREGVAFGGPIVYGDQHGDSRQGLPGNVYQSCEADFAFYSPESAVGRLRTGTIRTGDIYNLASWNNTIQIVTLRGSQLEGCIPAKDIERDRTYTLATTDFVVEEERDRVFGGGKVSNPHLCLRDETIQHVKRHGFV